mgnify:FL=1
MTGIKRTKDMCPICSLEVGKEQSFSQHYEFNQQKLHLDCLHEYYKKKKIDYKGRALVR